MSHNSKCPICGDQAKSPAPQTRTIEFKCERCGSFHVVFEANQAIASLSDEQRPKVSRWIRDQNRLGTIPKILPNDVADIIASPSLVFGEKADRLLLYLFQRTERYGQMVNYLMNSEIEAILETNKHDEVRFIAKYLQEKNWITTSNQNNGCVTGDGFARAEALRNKIIVSKQAFVAMWFHEDMKGAFDNGLAKGIQSAGYEAVRIDDTQHNDKICDQIIAEIRRSRFIVADFTGHRGGVYYEAGFAAGLGLPIIFTCRHDELSQLHFDVRQYNTIKWENYSDLSESLAARISATIGDGPLKK